MFDPFKADREKREQSIWGPALGGALVGHWLGSRRREKDDRKLKEELEELIDRKLTDPEVLEAQRLEQAKKVAAGAKSTIRQTVAFSIFILGVTAGGCTSVTVGTPTGATLWAISGAALLAWLLGTRRRRKERQQGTESDSSAEELSDEEALRRATGVQVFQMRVMFLTVIAFVGIFAGGCADIVGGLRAGVITWAIAAGVVFVGLFGALIYPVFIRPNEARWEEQAKKMDEKSKAKFRAQRQERSAQRAQRRTQRDQRRAARRVHTFSSPPPSGRYDRHSGGPTAGRVGDSPPFPVAPPDAPTGSPAGPTGHATPPSPPSSPSSLSHDKQRRSGVAPVPSGALSAAARQGESHSAGSLAPMATHSSPTSGSGATFGRVVTAMVTPFGPEGRLDLDGAASLARWLVECGNEGLVVAGTTGEAPTLSHAEQLDLIAAVVEAVDVPILAGAGSNDTAAAVELTEGATAAGAQGILSVTPYYNRPPQAGLLGHFRYVAEATGLPVIIYDIPMRTGRKVETDTLLELAHTVENIVGIKDAAGDPAETGRLIAAAPDGFEVYSGDDGLTLPLLSVGAVGVIGVATHWTAAEHLSLLDAWERGDVDAARRINAGLGPSFDYESTPEAPNPIPTKALLRVLGRPSGPCRPPMDTVPDGLADDARAVLATTRLGRQLGFG